MRLGILGGSFDPVHRGHLAVARAGQTAAALDEIWFTPSAIQPLKRAGPHASDVQRLEMLRLAIESDTSEPSAAYPRSWKICSLELDRGGVSYTVDTLRAIHAERPDRELFFLMGADALADVSHWKEPEEVFRLAMPLVARRAGQPSQDLTALAKFCPAEHAPQLIDMPVVDVCSTEIRQRIAAGESIDEMVPPAVARYIEQQQLYC